MDDLVEIGYVGKTHGYKGDLKIRIHEHVVFRVKKPNAFFVDIKEELLPFFTTSISMISELEAIIHFEDLENKEDAAYLKGKTLYLKSDDVEIDEEEIIKNKLIGYQLSDQTKGLIGEIEDVLEYPQQDLLVVKYEGKEVLIPFREELINNIDEEERSIVFNLPEGILDI